MVSALMVGSYHGYHKRPDISKECRELGFLGCGIKVPGTIKAAVLQKGGK
jgi:hypothetical protein